MSLYINPPNTPTPGNPAIDALYEADHPDHQSRMQGKSFVQLVVCTFLRSNTLVHVAVMTCLLMQSLWFSNLEINW
jgi:hypothetical protein